MNIAIDLRSLQSGKISGVENYALNLVENLLKIDKKNSYTFFYNSFFRKDVFEFVYVNSKTIKSRQPNKLLNSAFKLKALNFEKILGNVDCLFMPNLNQFHILPSTKLILTAHDLSPEVYPEFYDIKRRLWHKLINFRKAYTRADLIFAVSECTKLDLIRLYDIDPEKIKVINPGLDHLVFKEQALEKKRDFRNSRNLPGEFILFLNTIEPRKNLENLIKAFEKSDIDSYLVIAGKKGWKCGNIFKMIKNSKKAAKIIYLGYVSEEEKPTLISLATALAYPSFYEGFGFQPLESFAVGTPVITSQVSSLPEIVRDAALLVNPYSVADITKSLEIISNDEELRSALIKKGLQRARDFDWSFTAARTLKELNSLVVSR
jgi:glycosyltransferase involved in cell wall biosynthesis